VARQNDGTFPPFPIWDDVRTFDGKPWRGIVDVVSGGFPCTDISSARTNSAVNGEQKGLDGENSGLWTEQARIIREVEPIEVQVENSPNLTIRGLERVLWDLAEMGFNAKWGVLSGEAVNAPHERERMWLVATHPDRAQRKRGELSSRKNQEYADLGRCTWWKDKPGIHGVDDGVAHRTHRLKAIGNGQIPLVAATAWRMLGGE
jgi:DNA (cytosine-5)-methyltransferase 1